MASIDTHLAEAGLMDRLGAKDTPIHRLDPRAKLLTTLVFVSTVVSFGKYEMSALVPFSVYPIVLMALGHIPAAPLLRKIVMVAPFAVLIGVFNPLLDQAPILTVGSVTISGGWVSFASILIRFVLTVGAALVLLACTGIHGVCLGLDKLGVPSAFTMQLLFLYRYLFVLAEEGLRMVRARALRTFGQRRMGMNEYGHLLGHLLLRALARAQRIHSAMTCRGFDGRIHPMSPLKLRLADMGFCLGWSGLFVLMRLHNVSRLLGSRMTEFLP